MGNLEPIGKTVEEIMHARCPICGAQTNVYRRTLMARDATDGRWIAADRLQDGLNRGHVIVTMLETVCVPCSEIFNLQQSMF